MAESIWIIHSLHCLLGEKLKGKHWRLAVSLSAMFCCGWDCCIMTTAATIVAICLPEGLLDCNISHWLTFVRHTHKSKNLDNATNYSYEHNTYGRLALSIIYLKIYLNDDLLKFQKLPQLQIVSGFSCMCGPFQVSQQKFNGVPNFGFHWGSPSIYSF